MKITESDILNASILIVDDQESNVSLLEQMLHEAGYTSVASTMNPREVCALHRKNRYDLILLDLQMPGMDGFQVMEGLKTNDADSYLPVLVITAQPGHKLRALQAGAKDFISKPFDLVEVKTRIHNLLEVRLLYKALENHHKMPGPGPGASISKAVVERFRGETGFTTEKGKGTTFYFFLPECSEPAATASDAPPARPRILVCENDADLGKRLQIILEKAGCDSDLARDAAAAQLLLRGQRYHAMTLDLRLLEPAG